MNRTEREDLRVFFDEFTPEMSTEVKRLLDYVLDLEEACKMCIFEGSVLI